MIGKSYCNMIEVFLLLLLLITRVLPVAAQELSLPDYRLPREIVPSHYNVSIIYDIDPQSNFSFFGVVEIKILAVIPTNRIILHAADCFINYKDITLSGRVTYVNVLDARVDQYQRLILQFEKPIPFNRNFTLTIPYFGNLKLTNSEGVIIAQYANKTHFVREYLLATRFEPTFARKVFPCFDEPTFKATFTFALCHDKDFTPISNMPLENSVSGYNLIEDHWPWYKVNEKIKKDMSFFVWNVFASTQRMSSYMLGFVICKLKSSKTGSQAWLRVWTRPEYVLQTDYALGSAGVLVTHFEKWYDYKFPIPKLDIVAIPQITHASIENWGLLTVAESSLMGSDKYMSIIGKEFVTKMLAHGIAHQWLGGIVTMEWWSDVWFFEGFASYVAKRAIEMMHPTWKTMIQYDEGTSIVAFLDSDAKETAQSLLTIAADPVQTVREFDEITLIKASTLIRMLAIMFGEKTLARTLHKYLFYNLYTNFNHVQFWSALTITAEKNQVIPHNFTVTEIMKSWVTEPGYPLLTVTRSYINIKSFNVTQTRYLSDREFTLRATSSSWWIPIRVRCQKDDADSFRELKWITDQEGVTQPKIFAHKSLTNEWVLLNPDMIAPYRVNYDECNWMLLVNALRSPAYTRVPTLGRVQLLSDAFELAWSRRLNYSIPLQMATYLQLEQEYHPLSTGLQALAKIENILKRTENYTVFQKYISSIIVNTYNKVGGLANKTMYHNNDLKSVKMQILLSEWACRMDVPGCSENARSMFEEWMHNGHPDMLNPIPIDLRPTVYCTAVRTGGAEYWQFVLDRVLNTTGDSATNTLLYALSCTKNVTLINMLFELGMQKRISPTSLQTALSNVMRTKEGFTAGKDLMYTKFRSIYSLIPNQIGKVISVMAEQFTTYNELQEFNGWCVINAIYLSNLTADIKQGVAIAQSNVNWLSDHKDIVLGFLKQNTLHVNEKKTIKVFLKSAPLYNQEFVPRERNIKSHKDQTGPDLRTVIIAIVLTLFYMFSI